MAQESKDPQSAYRLIGPSEDGVINDLLAPLSAKDSRQRLQALIAEWLRMENLVVLSRSGTSVSCGGKTMEKLEHEVLATIKALSDLPTNIGAIIDARAATPAAGSSKIGFEDWLSFFSKRELHWVLPVLAVLRRPMARSNQSNQNGIVMVR